MAREAIVHKVSFESYLDFLTLRGVDAKFDSLHQNLSINRLENKGITAENLLVTVIGFNQDDMRQLGRVDVNPFGSSMVQNMCKLINATDIMLPRVDEPPREIRVLENRRDIADFDLARQMERVQNLGNNIQKRFMFLFAVIGKPEFAQVFSSGHFTLPGFVNSQFEAIQDLINEYYIEHAKTMNAGDLAEDYPKQLKPCIDLVSDEGIEELEDDGFVGIRSIMKNDLHRQLLLGHVLFQATQGVIPTHIADLPEKDNAALNPYETNIKRMLLNVNKVAMANFLTTPSDDIPPERTTYPLQPDNTGILKVFKAPLNKSLAGLILRLGAATSPNMGEDLALSIFRALDAAKEWVIRNPGAVLVGEVQNLFWLSPKSITALAQMVQSSGISEGTAVGFFLKEHDKWCSGNMDAELYLGSPNSSKQVLGLNKDNTSSIAKGLEAAFAKPVYKFGKRTSHMGGSLAGTKSFWNFKSPEKDGPDKLIFGHPPYYSHPDIEKALNRSDLVNVKSGMFGSTDNDKSRIIVAQTRAKRVLNKRDEPLLESFHSNQTLRLIQRVYDQVTSATKDMFTHRADVFPAQIVLNAVVLAVHAGEEGFDVSKNQARTTLARNLVKWYEQVSNELIEHKDDTRLILYKTALATALKIVSHTWRVEDLDIINNYLFNDLGAGFIANNPTLAWEILGQLLGDTEVTLPQYSNHFGEVKKRINTFVGSFIGNQWDKYTVGLDKHSSRSVRMVDALYESNGIRALEDQLVVHSSMREFFKGMWNFANKFPESDTSLQPHIKVLYDRATGELNAEKKVLVPQIKSIDAEIVSTLTAIKEGFANQQVTLAPEILEQMTKLMSVGTAQGAGLTGSPAQAEFFDQPDALASMITAIDGGARNAQLGALKETMEGHIAYLRAMEKNLKPLRDRLTRIQSRTDKLPSQLSKFFKEEDVAAALPS